MRDAGLFLRSATVIARLAARILGAPGSLLLVAVAGAGAAVVNPHVTDQPRFCLNCHTEEIYARDCGASEGYCLLGGSVDGICLTCHLKEDCCRPGQEHQRKLYLGKITHASGVVASGVPRAYQPSTLPLHQGRITCRTCHLHVQSGPGGYKMLRLVKITERGVDWSGLCLDCHKDR